MSTVSIRYASPADAELIADMSRETFYESFAAHNTKENMDLFMNGQFTREALIQEVEQQDGLFFLAYVHGKPVGYLRMRETNTPLELNNTPAIEIARIYLLQKNTGKGVGKALMEQAIVTAKNRGKQIIWLGVWEHNQKAISFYTKSGFERFGQHIFLLGKDVQIDWLMKKKYLNLFL